MCMYVYVFIGVGVYMQEYVFIRVYIEYETYSEQMHCSYTMCNQQETALRRFDFLCIAIGGR